MVKTIQKFLAFILVYNLAAVCLYAQDVENYNIPALFIENKGQMVDMAGSPVPFALYKAQASGIDLYLTETGLTYVFIKAEEEEEKENKGRDSNEEKIKIKWNRLDMLLKGANIKRENIIAEEKSSYFNQYFLPHCSTGISDVHSYKKITIKNVYPNIDWVLYNNNDKGFKYDFIVHPGANPAAIEIIYNSQKPVKFGREGELTLTSKLGSIKENAPYCYSKETTKTIESHFNIKEQQHLKGDYYQTNIDFKIADYNHSETLIIDPQLIWATLFGGGVADGPTSIETDDFGNVFIVGYEFSADFPTQNSGSFFQGSMAGSGDAFIQKFDNNGILIWSTYYGGSGEDEANSVAIDKNGNIFITGYTISSNFPTQNAGTFFQAANAGAGKKDVFILKFDNAGNRLWASYFGGANDESGSSILADVNGNIFITGTTRSLNLPVLNAGGFYQPTNGAAFFGGNDDAFFAEFSNIGVLIWSTYFGGGFNDIGTAICSDSNGDVYATGYTSTSTLPMINPGGNYFQSTIPTPGSIIAYILKFNNSTSLNWGTYYGGNGDAYGFSIAADKIGNIFIAGATSSANFPVLNTGTYFDGTLDGTSDAFILKFSNTGNRLWATYYGGSATDYCFQCLPAVYMNLLTYDNLAIDDCNNVYFSFETSSNDITTKAECNGGYFKGTYSDGGQDAFLTQFSNTGDLYQATYMGGDGKDFRIAIDVDNKKNLFVTGEWTSIVSTGSYPLTNPGTGAYYDGSFNGLDDGFVLKFKQSPLILSPASSNVSCSCDGTASVSPTGGCVNSYNYKWYNSSGNLISTSQNISSICSGNYKIIVSDTINCSIDSTVITVSGSGGNVIINSITSNPPSCNGGTGSATVNLSNGSGGTYTYSWSNGASTITNATSNTELLTSNTYTVTITDGGCSTTSTIQITEPAIITPGIITPTSASCGQTNGSAVTAVATGGTGTLSYSWSSSATGLTANALTAATYTLVITDANLCTATATTTINNIGGASISSVVPTNPLCNAGTGSATINISGGVSGTYTYSWSNGASTITTATSNQALLTSNTYTVTVTDGACITTTTITITQPNAITLSNPVVSNASCNQNNGSISITTSGGTGLYTYSWSNGVSATTTSATAQISNLLPQTYTLTVTDGNNCTQTTSVNISNAPAPIINSISIPTLNCNGNKGTVAVTASGTGILTYKWSSTAATNTTGIFNGITAGNYTVTVSDGNGCLQISTVLITQPNAISVTTPVATNTNCNQSTGTLTFATPTGGTGNYTYNWSNGASTQNISLLTATGYTVTVKDNNGCSITTGAIVNNTNGTSISSATVTNPLCNGNTGSATVTISASTTPYTYSWSNGASSITTATSNQELLTSNSYTLTITDGNNCSVTTTIVITDPSAIALASPLTTAAHCGQSDGTAQLTILGGTGLYTYSWSNGITGITSNTQLINATLAAGIFTLQVSDANGCTTSFSSGIANNNTPPVAAASATSYTISEGETTILSAGGGISYTWTPTNTLTCNSCPITIANPTATTTYTLIIKDNLGCADTTNITINVKKPCTGEEDVFIANLFSPNNDGKNDILLIQGNGLTNIYFSVYDRWGNKVFETRDQAQGWDGSINGNTANAGTYVYYLKATCKKTLQEIILKGNVSVVR